MQRNLLIITFSLGCLHQLLANPCETTLNLPQQIAAYYLSSLPSTNHQPATKPLARKRKIWQAEPLVLSEQEKAAVIFNQIWAYSPAILSIQTHMEPIMNEYAWNDLKLFRGTASNPAHHLLNCIDYTTTFLGKGALAIILATPTHHIQELSARQQAISTLCQDPASLHKLVELYQQYAAVETNILSLWSAHDPLYNSFYANFIEDVLYFNSSKTRRYNKMSRALELRKRCYFDVALALHATSLGFQSYYFYKVVTDYNMFKKITAAHNPLWVRILAWYPLATIPIELISTKKHYESWSTPLRYLAARLSDLQTWIHIAHRIDQLIAKDSALEQAYGPYLVHLRQLLHEPSNTELGRLVRQLATLPLKKWSVFLNNNGKLLQTYQLFLAHQGQLLDAMYDLGRLDVFLSTAQLLQTAKRASGEPAYTFTQFVCKPDQATPYIKLEDMWNPFLKVEKAVANSVEMGKDGVRNIILTGPNAGGKSVFLSGMAISLLLSQTLGIAPARSAIITPFYKISTYLDVTEDIAKGYSLFMAEVKRAQGYSNTLDCLEKNQWSFCVMDEIFSGTNPREGEAAAYSFVHHLTKYNQGLHIIATHFPQLTLLPHKAPECHIANYQVTANKREGRLRFTYKVVPGASQQTIALDILQEQGCNSAILKEAEEILHSPKD